MTGADVGRHRGGTTCELRDLRRVVEDRIDTGELVGIAMQNAMRMTPCGSGA